MPNTTTDRHDKRNGNPKYGQCNFDIKNQKYVIRYGSTLQKKVWFAGFYKILKGQKFCQKQIVMEICRDVYVTPWSLHRCDIIVLSSFPF